MVLALFDLRRPEPDAGFYGTEKGAAILKEMIEDYWRERGFVVEVGVQKVGFHPAIRAARFEVYSNIGPDGFPPKISANSLDVCNKKL